VTHKRAFKPALILLGALAGFRLSLIPALHPYKLLNVAGLLYTLLGVVVLSEIVATATWWKTLCVQVISPAIRWIHYLVPIGAMLGGATAAVLRKPSGMSVLVFWFGFWGASTLVLYLFEHIVVFPKPPFGQDVDSRWRWLGFFLVMCGVCCQLLAGIADMLGG